MLVLQSVHHPTAILWTETTMVCPSSDGQDMDWNIYIIEVQTMNVFIYNNQLDIWSLNKIS